MLPFCIYSAWYNPFYNHSAQSHSKPVMSHGVLSNVAASLLHLYQSIPSLKDLLRNQGKVLYVSLVHCSFDVLPQSSLCRGDVFQWSWPLDKKVVSLPHRHLSMHLFCHRSATQNRQGKITQLLWHMQHFMESLCNIWIYTACILVFFTMTTEWRCCMTASESMTC